MADFTHGDGANPSSTITYLGHWHNHGPPASKVWGSNWHKEAWLARQRRIKVSGSFIDWDTYMRTIGEEQ